MFKRGYYDMFHKMRPKHLNRYVKDFAGRHNIDLPPVILVVGHASAPLPDLP